MLHHRHRRGALAAELGAHMSDDRPEVPPPGPPPAERPTAGPPPGGRPDGAATVAPTTGRVPIGRLVAGAGLILVGVLWLIDAAGVVDLEWRVVLPALLTLVGVALLLTARRGAHGGLIAAGVVLGVLVISSATPIAGVMDGVGERDERPTDAVTAEAGYDLGMGSLRVDLTEIADLEDDATIKVSVGIGEAVVVLPEGVGARVDASAGIGEVSVLDRSRGGLGVSVDEEITGTPTIDLEVSAGIGRVEVTR
jgi:hypothetical protein